MSNNSKVAGVLFFVTALSLMLGAAREAVGPGAQVYAGTVNVTGAVTVPVFCACSDTAACARSWWSST